MTATTTTATAAKIQPLARPEPLAKAQSIARVMFERTDVETMAHFLHDFGLVAVETPGPTKYFRGYGPSAWLVAVTPAAENRFVGFAASVETQAELERLARSSGARIEAADGPGGGLRVRLTDPDGLQVDVLQGAEEVAPLPTRRNVFPFNTPLNRQRINQGVRTPVAPAPVFRLGHVVLQRPDWARAAEWYMRHLGLIASDVQVLEDGQPALGFFRLDRGATPTDHHSVALIGGPAVAMLHVSFETLDLDAVGQGHHYLKEKGWTPYWGIGRHELGSQIFDYWKDPVGDEWEHYADGDVMDASLPTHYTQFTLGSLWAWGDDLPDSMRPKLRLEDIPQIHAAGGFGGLELETATALMKAMLVKPRPWMT